MAKDKTKWSEELDRLEAEGRELETRLPLLHVACVMGFNDWPDVVRCAREGHEIAIELLCRRVERGL